MNKMQMKRWNHVVAIFSKLNEYIEKKYMIFDDHNELLPMIPFTIDHQHFRIYQKHTGVHTDINMGYFELADMYEPLKTFHKFLNLKAWGFVDPHNVERFKKGDWTHKLAGRKCIN